MICLPPDAMPFLRQQRTEYADNPTVETQAGYDADVAEFADSVRPFLPAQRSEMRFIDIGCGIGFGLLGLLRIYGPEHSFVAIDRGTQSSKVAYGFSEAPSAYNSLRLTRETLIGAGVSADRIECVDIDFEPFPTGSANIVTSTYAWGYHFPIDVYLEEVESVLLPDGIVIVDLRRGQGQESIVGERFEIVQAWTGPKDKSDRLILKRKHGDG